MSEDITAFGPDGREPPAVDVVHAGGPLAQSPLVILQVADEGPVGLVDLALEILGRDCIPIFYTPARSGAIKNSRYASRSSTKSSNAGVRPIAPSSRIPTGGI